MYSDMLPSKAEVRRFRQRFPDDRRCLRYLIVLRPFCMACRRRRKMYLRGSHFVCGCGRYQISPKAGTMFEKSRTSLQKWFLAMLYFSKSEDAMTAKDLQRLIGVTYKTAWRMKRQFNVVFAGFRPSRIDVAEWNNTTFFERWIDNVTTYRDREITKTIRKMLMNP